MRSKSFFLLIFIGIIQSILIFNFSNLLKRKKHKDILKFRCSASKDILKYLGNTGVNNVVKSGPGTPSTQPYPSTQSSLSKPGTSLTFQ